MVNYVDYITIDNEYIDTGYKIINDWMSFDISARVWVTENTSPSATFNLFNHPLFHIIIDKMDQQHPWDWRILTPVLYSDNNQWFTGDTLFRVYPYNAYRLEISIDQTNNTSVIRRLYNRLARQNLIEPCKFYTGTDDNPNLQYAFYEKNVYIGESEYIGVPWYVFLFYWLTIKKDGVVELDLKPCLDEEWVECVYDTVSQRYIYPFNPAPTPSDSMIRTVVLTWEWQELPVNDWIDISKLLDRTTPNDRIIDWYAAKYDSLCITAWEYNWCPVLVSDYTEAMQENTEYRKDYVTLLPRWRIELPRDRQIQALNRPMVKWNAWDIVKVAVR